MAHLKEEFTGVLPMTFDALVGLPFWFALAGVVLAWYLYLKNTGLPAVLEKRFSGLYALLENKYYLDRFNDVVFAKGARLLGGGLWRRGDQGVIDGFFVNGSARAVGWIASVLRQLQTGILSHYAISMLVGVLALMTWFVVRQIIFH
jgi:NADH-quinone oxidoreductase subunit L